MLNKVSKKGKFAIGVLSAALSVTLVSPASAAVPPGTPPADTQDFASNGKATTIYGSGSDTTFPMHQAFGVLFNRAPGCTLQNPTSASQDFDMVCDEIMNLIPSVAARTGYANYDRDQSSDYYFIGSGGGRNHVRDWNQGLVGAVQADYFRSSSSGFPTDGRSIAFSRDALAAFTFDEVKINGAVVDTPGKSITKLTQVQVVSIWQGNIKCWATIDKSLSQLTSVKDGSNTDYITASNFDESKWIIKARVAAGAGYATSDEYKACNPMAVYTVPQTSGTAQAWNTLAAGGSSSSTKSEDFLTKEDPMTGAIFTTAEKLERLIPENNASPIANRIDDAGINTDVTTNAIYFYSVGKYTTALGGLDGSGNPKLFGNSTKQDGFKDRLLDAVRTGSAEPVLATRANIESTSSSSNYLYARSLFFGYQYPNQATRNFLDPIKGFMCTTETDNMSDPINSFNVRDQIEEAILGAGFFPFSTGVSGVAGNTTLSYCRLALSASGSTFEDATAPTVGFTTNTSTLGATTRKPIVTITFGELVSGVSADTVGIREFDGTNLVGSNVESTLVCTNARQVVIPCLAKTSPSNYDRAPLEFVSKVTVTPVANLTASKMFKVFALGTSGAVGSQVVEIQDRSGLSDWPIIDGNPLVNASSSEITVPALELQTLATPEATAVTVGQTISFSNVTSANTSVVATSSTPELCSIASVGVNFVITGISAGTCNIFLEAPGSSVLAEIVTVPIAITVNAKSLQSLPEVAATVNVGDVTRFSRYTDEGFAVTAESSTPSTCTVALGSNRFTNNSYFVTGVSAGACRITLAAAENDTYAGNSVEAEITVAEAGSKLAQILPLVPTAVVAGSTMTFSRYTDEDLAVVASSSTPTICTVARGNSRTNNNSYVVTGVIGGACRISLSQAGNDTYAAVPATEVSLTVNKRVQAAPTVGTKVVVKKSITFSKNTNQGLAMTPTSTTPTICSVRVVGNNISVTGLKVGSCKMSLTQLGNASVSALPTTVKTIAVTAK